MLIAYLGICSFGDYTTAEINGMTHPNFRRKGFFTHLLKLAVNECKNRDFSKILLLTDNKSKSGKNLIKSVNGKYKFSEYHMKLNENYIPETNNIITLRAATDNNSEEIWRQDAIYGNYSEEAPIDFKIETDPNISNYLALLDNRIVGKINVDYNNNEAFIFGFGILPDFRGKGYGKETLKGTLNIIIKRNINIIELDVECNNDRALNLYKSCGFVEVSSMNYYECNVNE